jgi:hypothetical protein
MGETYLELEIKGSFDSILQFALKLCSVYQTPDKHASYYSKDGLHCFSLARDDNLDAYIKNLSSELGIEVRKKSQ